MAAQKPAPFAVCFSGHRPEKLPEGDALRMLLSLLYREIENAARDGATVFYSGCAPGIDLWAADMVLMQRSSNPALKLVCVLPFPEQGNTLRGDTRYHYETVLRAADRIETVGPHYYRGCYQARNQYLVMHSSRLIAVVTDMKSGTGQTIRIAERAGVKTRIVNLAAAAAQGGYAHEYLKY
ncbi:MAG: DUF1273 family protein [Oscillospiraceae bacterium]|nr:DUF1273 family protein [Oscillospiraceae bacterium]